MVNGTVAHLALVLAILAISKTFWRQKPYLISRSFETPMPLFTKLLTPGLTCELCNPFDDWLELVCLANNRADNIIFGLNRELKSS